MGTTKQERMLEIFFRSLHGEEISVQRIAGEYGVSTKSISRNINDLKAFLADHRELVGNSELKYSYRDRSYRLCMDEYLSNKEFFALVEILIGARIFRKDELASLIEKLKRFTPTKECPKFNELIRKELYHYPEINHNCKSVLDNLWRLIGSVAEKREISIVYYNEDEKKLTYRLKPIAVEFIDSKFYLIALKNTDNTTPVFFRIDRIEHIIEHRCFFKDPDISDYDEKALKKMFDAYTSVSKNK